MKHYIREDRMIKLSRDLGFTGWDARDAAFYIAYHDEIQTPVCYDRDTLEWFIDPSSTQHKHGFTWVLIKYGEYFKW